MRLSLREEGAAVKQRGSMREKGGEEEGKINKNGRNNLSSSSSSSFSVQGALRSHPYCTLSEFLLSSVLNSQAMAQLMSLLKISPAYHALLCECVYAASSVVADGMIVDFILTQKKSILALERKRNKKEREEVDAPETICVEMLND